MNLRIERLYRLRDRWNERCIATLLALREGVAEMGEMWDESAHAYEKAREYERRLREEEAIGQQEETEGTQGPAARTESEVAPESTRYYTSETAVRNHPESGRHRHRQRDDSEPRG